ncbi:MAG: LPS assembly protein LptD [Alphaproteobacteria bacterium]|nr:LPS assembly protein LptD [Alphaproteobacteria bacterium]
MASRALNFAIGAALLACATSLSAPSALAQSVSDQPAVAQSFDQEGLPILLRAEEVSHDQDLGVIVARGDVEIAHGDRILLADTLSYNQNAKTVTASGNIRILEPTGEVIFADYVELSEDMRDGTIENLRILLADNARIAAAGGRRSNGDVTEMAKAVYSPCEVCKEDPSRAPLWQVKAERVIHDQSAQQVEYYDAVLEMYGVPVAYSPYFTHPDPTVKRRTGFLAPSFGSKTNTGWFLRTPFFWNIAPDKDATLDPILTGDQGVIYSGEYREAFDKGYLETSGSFTITDEKIGSPDVERIEEDVFRGHFFSEGQFMVDETWRWGWDVNRSTDQTYLRKFSFWENPGDSMTSEAYAEGFRGRNYSSARTYSFQNLRQGQRSDTPLILPLLDYNGLGEADSMGGRWSLDANFRGLTDGDDADSQRFSLQAGYRREIIADFGLVTTLSGSLRGDVYNVDQSGRNDDAGRAVDDGLTGRVVPRISAETRYPMARYSVGGRQVIEPIVALHAAPNGGNNEDIPNNDSIVFETDDINILSANRSNGLDRVETGQKVVAGMNLAHYGDDGGRFAFFIGQSYRLHPDQDLKRDTGIENERSDWVGRLEISPNQYFSAFYRFNFQADDFLANRNELTLSTGGEGFRINANYTFVRDNLDPSAAAIEELSLSLNNQFNDYWSTQLATLQDLEEGGGSLSHSAGLIYEDECFIFSGRYVRTFTRSADVEEEDSLLFRLTYKTLGEVEF